MSDNYLRHQALDITKSFIVQAPAGSGKTELLTTRYLKTLSTVKNPENIICLTFTKKSVAELKFRIINSLQFAAKNQEPKAEHKKLNYVLAAKVLELDKKYNWNILTNLSRIQVLTFDALALKIASNYNESDFSNLNIISKNINIYKNSAKKILLELENSQIKDSVLYLLKKLDNNINNFIRIIAMMLAERLKWLEVLTDKKFSLNSIKQTINNLIKQHLKKIDKLAKNILTNNFFNLADINTNLVNFKHQPKTLNEYIEIANLCLTKKGDPRKSLTKKDGFNPKDKKQKQDFLNFLNNLPNDFINQLITIRTLPDNVDEELLEHIAKILITANFFLEEEFIKHNGVDYQQINLLAKNNLTNENVSNIALSLDNKIEHILIDEFQDTSFTQLDLITEVVKNWEIESHRTLFIVGDPMQSIYLFRSAQVEVFLTVRDNGIAHLNLESIVLTNNFRSSANIVATNNKIFSQIFPTKDNYEVGGVKYSPATTTNNKNSNNVFIHPFADGEEDRELENIKQIILKNNNKSIAILSRNKKDFIPIAKKLSENNITFSAYQNIKLSDDSFIKDLVVICTILLNKNDKLAWLSLLRSPYIGLELDELLEFSNCDDIYNTLDIIPKLKPVKNIFNYAFDNLGVFDFIDSFLGVLYNLGITKNLSHINNESLIIFTRVINNLSVNNELNLDNLKSELNNLFIPDIKSNIQLMSIHQAKGLEFDIVILPNLNNKTKIEEGRLLYATNFINSGTLIAPKDDSKIYNFLKTNHFKRLKLEEARLLYVAMSRAKEELHLSACCNSISKQTFLYLLKDIYGEYWDKFAENSLGDTQHQEVIINYKLDNKLEVELKEITKAEHITSFDFTNCNNKTLGTILHKFLQLENFNPSENEILNQLIIHNLAVDKFNDNKIFIQNILDKIKNSKDFNFIFKNRDTTLREQEIISDNKIYVIDRLFIDDNIVYIIDFKLSFDLNDIKVVNQYKKQLKTYALIVKNIYNYEIKTAIFSLNEAKLFYV